MAITYSETEKVFVAEGESTISVRALIRECGRDYRPVLAQDWVSDNKHPETFRTLNTSSVELFLLDECDELAKAEIQRRMDAQAKLEHDERITHVTFKDGRFIATGGTHGCEQLAIFGWHWTIDSEVKQLVCTKAAIVDDSDIPSDAFDAVARNKLDAWRKKRAEKVVVAQDRKALKENMLVDLSSDGLRFVATNSYHQRDQLHSRGWRYNGDEKTWSLETTSDHLANLYYSTYPLIGFMNPAAKTQAMKIAALMEQEIAASKATDAEIVIPAPAGMAYLPFQRAGIAYLLGHHIALLADEMGLGKTIQAIGVANADPEVDSVLVVCPASLKLNWRREFEKWGTHGWTIAVAGDKKNDHLLAASPVVIINYDLLSKYQDALAARHWGMLVFDEAHYLKNKRSKRSSSVFGVSVSQAMARMFKKHISEDELMSMSNWTEKRDYLDRLMTKNPAIQEEFDHLVQPGLCGKRRIFITGTPIPNRPVELFPLLQQADPIGLGKNYDSFVQRYCAAIRRFGHWDAKGASNLDELQTRLRSTCMVRRLKKDVLPDLPPKYRQIVEIEAVGKIGQLVKMEVTADEHHRKTINAIRTQMAKYQGSASADFKASVRKLENAQQTHLTEMARIRHELAVAKIPAIIEHVHAIFDDGCEKLIVMAHHKDVVNALAQEFSGSALVTGDIVADRRQEEVDRFNDDKDCHLFIGSIKAAGVGLNLVSAHTILFAEHDWTPSNIHQAEDRCHRIGQNESVLVQFLVVDGSLDARMAKMIDEKSDVIDQALNVTPQAVKLLEPIPMSEAAKTQQQERQPHIDDTEEEKNKDLPLAQISAIHDCLKILAENDPDYASEANGAGFNKLDGERGHRLAALDELSSKQAVAGMAIIAKYKRQLPEATYCMALGIDLPSPTPEVIREEESPITVSPTPSAEPAYSMPSKASVTASEEPVAAGPALQKRKRGRPKVYVDKAPPTTTERSKKSIQSLAARGGKRLMLRLTPEAYDALRTIMVLDGIKEETGAINQILISRKRELLLDERAIEAATIDTQA